jgi:hypothetical protein
MEGEDRQSGLGGAAVVELDDGQAHELVALEVGAFAEELPPLVLGNLGCEAADGIVDKAEESVDFYLEHIH